MMKRLSFIFKGFLLTCLTFQVSSAKAALGNEGAHGGDDIGLEFRITAQAALDDIRKNRPDIRALFDLDQAQEKLEKAIILAVETSLKVSLNGKIQDSVAINDPATNTILLNRARWISMTDPRAKLGLALHEVLGLLNFEQTGFYPVSSRYIAQLGLTGSPLTPSPDRDRTYMSCLDLNSSIYFITISADNHLTAEVRGVSAETLDAIQETARREKIPRPEQVVGFSATIATEFYMGSIIATPNCRFDHYNRFVLACDGDSSWFYYPDLPKEVQFKYADGTKVNFPVLLTRLVHFNTVSNTVLGPDDRLSIYLNFSHSQLSLSFESSACH